MVGRNFEGHMNTLGKINGIITFDRPRSIAQGEMKVRNKIYAIDGVFRDGKWCLDLVPKWKGRMIVLNVRRSPSDCRLCSGNYDSMGGPRGKVEFALS